jgi:Vitamin K-dependent gamma-carboxylase
MVIENRRLAFICYQPISIWPLVTFRVVFGLMMLVSTVRFLWLGWVEDHYLSTQVQFKYYGFEWVQTLPSFWLYTLHYLMLAAAMGILLGAFYRLSAVVFFLTFTYVQLIDLTYYLNHYYFVSWVALLLIFVPAHAQASVDTWRGRVEVCEQVPAWSINIIKFQIAVVYIYAGLAKINYDWLVLALPLKIWLPAADKIPILGPLFKMPIMPYLFSWAGMLYDTFIVFFLMYRPTRIVAYGAVLAFHIVVGILFQIGVFPLVMIGATLIFFSDEWHIRLYANFPKRGPLRRTDPCGLDFRKVSIRKVQNPRLAIHYSLLFIYFMFQLLFPLRYLLYDGNVFWTEEGYRFSWRVMLMEKAGTATFYVKDRQTGREGVVNNGDFLNTHQEKQMAMQPDMILQYAHFLKEYYQKKGVHSPAVRAEVYVTLNARPSRLLIDPAVDLTQIQDSWHKKKWIRQYDDF